MGRTMDVDPARSDAVTVVHDLGSGTGSLGRWLAPVLEGPQHWVLHDRDADLLRRALTHPPLRSANGAAVTVETRHVADVTRLSPEDLCGASLVTASALLDMLTAAELERLVRLCVAAGCPALVTISVTGRVELTPAEPLDTAFGHAFNDHQRRTVAGRSLLGPDAVAATVGLFRSMGAQVRTDPSPWQLDARCAALTSQWLDGWVGAACEQQPELAASAVAYLARRRAQLRAGLLRVTIHHLDLWAQPCPVRG
jgi:hypothetical protein